ncbi:MAG TPA: SUMF1/EgtB/PvdO family nonheme iron enzyme [Candidatus Sulfotelmatobacter sp.]|nr:SUMF1/EgtB/PvdO family nonheme iron enzyme [Candidatus Sulfotelmatobacter sp.]
MLTARGDIAVSHQLLERLSDAQRRSDALFNLVHTDAIYNRPIPERHRIIFYMGHLEAFDWNLLHENALGLKSFHPEFDRLFAFGIDPVGGGLPADQPSDWPSLGVVRDYVTRIRAALDDKLINGALEPFAQGRDGFPLDTLINVAIEHRLMHVETLAYMLHQLPYDRKVRYADSPLPVPPPVAHRMIEIPAGMARLGLVRGSENFGWDNEYEAHELRVPAFEIDQYMVTNQQYLDFMAAGGYETRAFWTDEDWKWKTSCDVTHPVFWLKDGDGWFYRTMFEEIPLPPDWPVYVSHAEAEAFARWAGKSLPTEAEWQCAAYGPAAGDAGKADLRPHFYPWGSETPHSKLGNFDLNRWNPTPVNAFPDNESAFGVHGMLGNGWEWTSTVFAPFPGFEPFPFYRGYSADFFDGKHFVMKGGSARTAACMLRPTFRNWFQPHYQYVYAGFRCVSH